MAQFARLPHKATGQHGTVIDMRTAGDDEVVTNHPVTDIDRRLLAAVDTAVSQSARARDRRIVLIVPQFTKVTCAPSVPRSEACLLL